MATIPRQVSASGDKIADVLRRLDRIENVVRQFCEGQDIPLVGELCQARADLYRAAFGEPWLPDKSNYTPLARVLLEGDDA